jgi:hypothetical protein
MFFKDEELVNWQEVEAMISTQKLDLECEELQMSPIG